MRKGFARDEGGAGELVIDMSPMPGVQSLPAGTLGGAVVLPYGRTPWIVLAIEIQSARDGDTGARVG